MLILDFIIYYGEMSFLNKKLGDLQLTSKC